ncbi:MAG: phage portal protein [Clostridia bacterium]|nr:phage portal protein [Clostridia bacterium]
MITYEDLLAARNTSEAEVMELMRRAVAAHCGSELYRTAADAVLYDKRRNATIERYQKLLYTLTGRAVPDTYSTNLKTRSLFFPYFVTQEAGYLLGNGVSFQQPETKPKLGRDFDRNLLNAGHDALVQGAAYVFWNLDHTMYFTPLEFVPLYSEENGGLSAGIRWWTIDASKPVRYTLYEMDGYTEYRKPVDRDMEILVPKRPYRIRFRSTEAEGATVLDYGNYPGFPIVPLYADRYRQSRLVGLRESIDCYDLIKSGFANDVDEASLLYWTLTNAEGMEYKDFVQFRENLRTTRFGKIPEDVNLQSHSIDPPYQARKEALTRLSEDLYRDGMALDVREIPANATATEIRFRYEPLDKKTDEFEAQVTACIAGILTLAGIEDEPTYSRSRITNQYEETQMVMLAAAKLDDETLIRKLPFLTPDEQDVVIERMDAVDFARFGGSAGSNTAGGQNGSEGNSGALGGDDMV